MTDHNLAGLIFKKNLEEHPEVFTIDEEKLTKQINNTVKETQRLHAKNDASRKSDKTELRKEYNSLRQQLVNLQNNVKGLETRINNIAGDIHLYEHRITELIKTKKSCGNPLAERMYEHQIESLESEKLDAEQRLVKERNYHKNAVRELKAFDKHDRIAELAKQLGE